MLSIGLRRPPESSDLPWPRASVNHFHNNNDDNSSSNNSPAGSKSNPQGGQIRL